MKLLTLSLLLLCSGCASGLCQLNASIQQARLERVGLPSRVGVVQNGRGYHSVVVWRAVSGTCYFWDGKLSYQYVGRPEEAIPDIMHLASGRQYQWVRWETEAK